MLSAVISTNLEINEYNEEIDQQFQEMKQEAKCLDGHMDSVQDQNPPLKVPDGNCNQCKSILFSRLLKMFIFFNRTNSRYKTQCIMEFSKYICENIEYFREYRNLMEVLYDYMTILITESTNIQNETLKQNVENVILDLDNIFSFMHLYH
jgi:hypothetical protein